VPVDRIKIIIFTLSGFMAALSAIIMAARFGSTRPDIATGMDSRSSPPPSWVG
jgi:rhamnose transport system permease protein